VRSLTFPDFAGVCWGAPTCRSPALGDTDGPEDQAQGREHREHAHCQDGHEWGLGLTVVSWSLCDCPLAVAACRDGPSGHLAVYRAASPGCRPVWYRPRHKP
jgi:hypothetical protein